MALSFAVANRFRVLANVLALCAGAISAHADTPLPILGGSGGGAFDARCLPGKVLWGVELRAADDVDAVRPVCVTALRADQVTDDTVGDIWHGGDRGTFRRIACPLARPVVLGQFVAWEGVNTQIVNDVHLFCGRVTDGVQALEAQPSAVFDGPAAEAIGNGSLLFPKHSVTGGHGLQRCPPGQVAVGLRGRSGVFLDAVGLICDASPISDAVVHSIGKVTALPGTKPGPKLNDCQAAVLARSRGQTVVATALDARCLASFKH